jgi:23S rRNA (pseudouridine1915-N3)-methyltransferase
MKLRILAVGKLKEPYSRAAVADYLARVRRTMTCEMIEVKDGSGERDERRIRALEAQRLRAAIAGGDRFRVALDQGGRAFTSAEFADFLGERMNDGSRELVFMIGGPYGLEPDLRGECQLGLSLSRFTLPHQLARVVLVEQIYRALTILRGEPYHK